MRDSFTHRDPPPASVTRLLPVIARAVELGRGPPGLVGWVREQLRGEPPGDPTAPDRVGRLARELARRLAADPASDTIVGQTRPTLRGAAD